MVCLATKTGGECHRLTGLIPTSFQRWRILCPAALVLLTLAVRGQNAVQWTSYKMADGLAEPVFNAVSFTPQGRLLAATLRAPLAAELDGYSVSNFPAPPDNLGRLAESPGGQRWALVPAGLMEMTDQSWKLHPVAEIAAARAAGFPIAGHPPDFLPVRQGCVLFLLPQGLLEFSAENPDTPGATPLRLAAQGHLGPFTGMAAAADGRLWITGDRGLAALAGPVRNLNPASPLQEYLPPPELPLIHFRQPETSENGTVTLLAESTATHQQVVVIFDGQHWLTLPAGPRNFSHAWTGPDQSLWAVTSESLFQWHPARTNWDEIEDISAGQISDVAREPGGAFWLATADGLFRCAPPLWAAPEPVRDLSQPVTCLTVGETGDLYFIAGDQLHWLQDDIHRAWPLPADSANSPATQSLLPLKDGSLLVTLGDSAWQFQPPDHSFTPLPLRDPTQPVRALGRLPDGSVCLWHGGARSYFDAYDGAQFRPWPDPPSLRPEGASFTTLFAAPNGNVWLGGDQAIWLGRDGRSEQFSATDDTTPSAAVAFAALPDGKIGCATPDQLWEFDGANWLLVQARFNHLNALLRSRAGDLWLASNGGLFRFCAGVWLNYGTAEGLPNGAVYALAETPAGRLWAATAHGLRVFHPEADPDPPRTDIRMLAGDDRRLAEGDTLNLLFAGRDKWRHTPPDGLFYSYQLDHLGWSPFKASPALALPGLAAGRHFLQVRALDRNGNVDPRPPTLDFAVVTPWFRETRLWLALSFGLAAAVFFAALAWHRHRQLIRSYAAVEQKVAERTRELEIATRELLHSQKMNALGTLAAGIAHDFNNILSIIKGSAQIIEENPGHPEKIRTRLARIKTVVQQGAEIVDAMLGFSRGSDTPAAPCDLNTVVDDTLKLLGDRFLREAELKFERAENLPELSVAREFIQQILINLIFNAAEAMTGRQQITLATRLAEQPPADLVLNPSAAPAYVLISVRDQGAGIPPEIKARVFEPFFTTKALSTRRGTGLGLSMVYELAKKMGAGLAVQSVVGQGSVFTLILPAPPRAENPAATQPS